MNTVREKNVHLVGLSALMTTTLKSMEETHCRPARSGPDCKIWWAVRCSTPEYAEKIGADWYAKDAKRSADIAKEFSGRSKERRSGVPEASPQTRIGPFHRPPYCPSGNRVPPQRTVFGETSGPPSDKQGSPFENNLENHICQIVQKSPQRNAMIVW